MSIESIYFQLNSARGVQEAHSPWKAIGLGPWMSCAATQQACSSRGSRAWASLMFLAGLRVTIKCGPGSGWALVMAE